MLKLNSLQSIFLFFSVFGPTSYNFIFTSKRRSFLIIAILKIFYLIFISYSFVITYVVIRKHPANFIICFKMIVNAIEVVEGWLYAKQLQLLVENTEELIDYLKTRVNINIQQFVRRFYRKVFCMVFVSFIDISVKISIPISYRYSDNFLVMVHLFKNIGIMHTNFYVDLQEFVMMNFNEKLNPDSSKNAQNCLIRPIPFSQSFDILFQTNTVYQKISKMSKNINERFGAFLLASIIDTMLIAVHSTMFIIHYISTMKSKEIVLRKFVISSI